MKTFFVTPACYLSIDPLEMFAKSCALQNITLRYYGIGTSWTSYHDIKITQMLKYLKENVTKEYTHIHVNDIDVLMLASEKEINGKFTAMKSPLVMEMSRATFPDAFERGEDEFPPAPTPYRFVCGGGYMGTKQAIFDALEILDAKYSTYNDLVSWSRVWLDGDVDLQPDYYCNLFFVADGMGWWEYHDEVGRVFSIKTYTYPTSIHFAGRLGGRPELFDKLEDFYAAD